MTTECTDLYLNTPYYCEKGDSHKLNACCFNPDNFNEYDISKINQEFKKHTSQIKNLILVNPSQYISKIDFANFTNLETLTIEAQDVNCDGLKYLPKEIFKLPKLKKIHSEGERFLKSELSKIKAENPQIEFTGWSLEYDFDNE